MENVKMIFKTWNGIKYYSNKISDGKRFWQSKTHPNYKHFQKSKTTIQ